MTVVPLALQAENQEVTIEIREAVVECPKPVRQIHPIMEEVVDKAPTKEFLPQVDKKSHSA